MTNTQLHGMEAKRARRNRRVNRRGEANRYQFQRKAAKTTGARLRNLIPAETAPAPVITAAPVENLPGFGIVVPDLGTAETIPAPESLFAHPIAALDPGNHEPPPGEPDPAMSEKAAENFRRMDELAKVQRESPETSGSVEYIGPAVPGFGSPASCIVSAPVQVAPVEFGCLYCNRTFRTRQALSGHQRAHKSGKVTAEGATDSEGNRAAE